MKEKIDIYLAGPYTPNHKGLFKSLINAFVMFERFKKLTIAAGMLAKEGIVVFSPITHSHPLANYVKLPTSWDFWKKQDLAFLNLCKVLMVLQLPGWDESKGVREEIKYCETYNIPIIYWNMLKGDMELRRILEETKQIISGGE